MSQEEINNDLGSYIHERKDNKAFWKKLSKPKIKPKYDETEMDAAIEHEMEVDGLKKTDTQQELSSEEKELKTSEDQEEVRIMEKEIETVNKVEEKVDEAIDEEREGILKRLFKKINFSKKKEDVEVIDIEEEVQENKDDEELKDLLQGLHAWIVQLPPEKLSEFKNSKDFELYTKYLRKYNMIK